MRAFIFLISCCLILACNKDEPRSEWKTLDFDTFTVEAPSDWRQFSRQGYDSRVGGITNGKDTLNYDYGMYSYTFISETSQTHIITEKNRDGYPTRMVQPRKPGDGLIGIYYDLGNSLRLTLFAQSRNESVFVQILDSVKIK